jgi:hypothetical protein
VGLSGLSAYNSLILISLLHATSRNEVEPVSRGLAKPAEALSGVEGKTSLRGAH